MQCLAHIDAGGWVAGRELSFARFTLHEGAQDGAHTMFPAGCLTIVEQHGFSTMCYRGQLLTNALHTW